MNSYVQVAALFQTKQPQSPALGILLILAILGVFYDRSYKKAGGVRPSGKENFTLLVVVVVLVGFVFTLGLMGRSAEALGGISAFLTILVFGMWELHRWSVRRKNPVVPASFK